MDYEYNLIDKRKWDKKILQNSQTKREQKQKQKEKKNKKIRKNLTFKATY